MSTILISGGTGLIGKHLYQKLREEGYEVAILGRASKTDAGIRYYRWDPCKQEIERGAIESVDYIIHLAGTNLGEKRWTKSQRHKIIDSRVKTADLLYSKVKELNPGLKAFISASGTNYYGTNRKDRIFIEADPPGDDYLSDVCNKWEQAADKFLELGIRTVKIRSGVVLTKQGGALAKMIVPVKLGIGSPFGSGEQYLPWIHIDDLCAIYIMAIEDERMKGAFNAVAPDYKSNTDFMHILADAMKKSFWFPNVPVFLLKLLLGRRAAIILEGNRISPEKILGMGFQYRYSNLKSALSDLLH